MLKFPSVTEETCNLSNVNGNVSEYLGCHIFNELGIQAQDTILGTFLLENGKIKNIVACRDFCKDGRILQDFVSLRNRILSSDSKGLCTELDSILETIEKQDFMSPKILEEYFWNMFIVDAYIGNWDRHNGNWGFLYDQADDSVIPAPVFDCGSCLYPSADGQTMRAILNDMEELNVRIYERPTSAIMKNGKRIKYHEFINSLEYDGCNRALLAMYPKISSAEKRIEKIIEDTPFITDLQKEFYKTILAARKEKILKAAYEKLLMQQM